MPLAVRHRHQPSPHLSPLPGVVVARETDPQFMATLQGRAEHVMMRRFADGHRAYVAWSSGVPAAWGWVATRVAHIGELGSTFDITDDARYLWNFVTLPAHRGLGIYPRLLDAIVRAESVQAERFWVAYAPENHASGIGIRKAGFTDVATLSFDASGAPAVGDLVSGGAQAAAAFLGIRAAEEALAPCWKCARKSAPAMSSCHAGSCACDYQRVEVSCAT